MRRSLVALVLALVLPLPGLSGQVTVKEGETLSEVAERYGISVTQLMKLNGLSNADHVETGQTLTLPGDKGARSTGAGAAGAARVTVNNGETLSEIADRQGMSVSQLMKLNNLANADHVESGQSLLVSGRSQSASTVTSFPKGASAHVVRSGESLSVIADGYGIPISKLIAINSISDPNHVESGTRLKLKGSAPAPRPTASKPAVVQPLKTAVATKPVVSSPKSAIETQQPIATAAAVPATVVAPTTQPKPAITPISATPSSVTPPSSRPIATVATAPRPSSTTAAAISSKPDWRTYGPMQIDWTGWQPLGGSMVAPSLNAQGQSLYLAINCGARKLNATTQTGDWKTWDDPSSDFEQKLVNDYCRSRG